MTDEERQRAMDFIVEQQAKFCIDVEQINESYPEAEHRFKEMSIDWIAMNESLSC